MFERGGYRAALYLSALIAVVHGSFFMYALWYFPRFAHGVAVYVLGAVAVSVGLWLLSKIARYIGAVFYLFSAGVAAFPLLGFGRAVVMNVGAVWAVTMGILSLAAALILVFSKPFAKEFAAELEKRPTYKKRLLNIYTILIVLPVVAATLIDIVNLASN